MLSLIQAKACKKCGGDLSIDCDVYGILIECIQCGATWNKNDLRLAEFQKIERTLKAIAAKPLTAASSKS